MSWRWQPPVLSPVSPLSPVSGLAAAYGLFPSARESAGRKLACRYGAMDVLLTDSGTSALILAMQAVVPPGGTVAYPGYACIDLTAAAVRAGIRVRLYDVDPLTLSPDLDSIREVIARGVDAIVVAHLYGYPADVTAVRTMAATQGITVIEDAAQGAGGTLAGASLGSLADISILSFGRGKGTTAGAGGAVIVRTPALAEWMRTARETLRAGARGGPQVARLGAQWLFSHPLLYRIPVSVPALGLGEMVYHPAAPPRAITAAAAAVIPTALAMHDTEVARRRANARTLMSRANGSSRMRPVRAISEGEPGYLRLAFLDPGGHVRERASLGAVRGYPLTLDQHTQLRPILAPRETAGKGSAFLRDRLFTVPTHSSVGSGDLDRLADWLKA